MSRRLRRGLYRAVGRIPGPVRGLLMRAATPTYTVGASCRILDADGNLLLVKAVYRDYWTLPGGFTNRGEDPAQAAVRETTEETGVRPDLIGEPFVVLDPEPRRIEFVFQARFPDDYDIDLLVPASAEISDIGWFPLGSPERVDVTPVDEQPGAPLLMIRRAEPG